MAEGHSPLPIQTAGNHRSVAENGEMILEAVTENGISPIVGGHVGPLEAVTPLDVQLVSYAHTLGIFYPFTLK